jgi:hypothetical protein
MEPSQPLPPNSSASSLTALAQAEGLRTHQDAINYFYRVGGGTWDGASAAAKPYGVDLMALTKDRGALLDPNAPPQPANPTTLQPANPTTLQPANPTTPQPANPVAPSGAIPRTRDGMLLAPDGKVESFLGANYTDIGLAHIQDPTSPAFREAVGADLDRLKAQGMHTVRVWAAPPNIYPDGDTTRMAQRVDVIAQEAAKRGMNITVDLVDSFGKKSVSEYREGELGVQLDQRIPGVVGANKHHPNIDWSVGNEIGDPHRPMEFAQWYTEQVGRIRAHAGQGQRIITEMTPGAVGHPDHGWPEAHAAMKKIVEVSDVIGIHFYPVGAPGALSGPRQDGTWPAADWDSIRRWADLAKKAKKPFVIGEFSIPRDAEAISREEYIQQTNAWLKELRDIGTAQVRFWQFLKAREGGHTDPAAVDFHHPDTQPLLDSLHHHGWFAPPR